jgi:tRNA A37 N6-isopentenylltransferase MiaA
MAVNTLKRLLVISGQTGVGKSEVAQKVANRMKANFKNIDMICADST